MGSSKKRKEKARDFAKAKLKLGKGKQKAANATDTSFSSRSIALGQQSIGKEHKDAPTTKRNLTLEDLQTQLKHYSANTRKDALAGLRELLTAFPEQLLYPSISTLVPSLARLIGDEEASVRKALLSFLSWYLPSLPPLLLQPQHSILVFFTTSALSHIFPDVRLDAVRMLNLLLDVCPDSVILDWDELYGPSTSASAGEQNHGERVLECYLALLHIRSGVATNGLKTDMSPASKALVLGSLAKFVRLSFTPEGALSREEMEEQASPHVPSWFMSESFATSRDYEAFVNLLEVPMDEEVDTVGLDDDRFERPEPSLYLGTTSLLDEADLLGLGAISDISNELLDGKGSLFNSSATRSVPQDPQSLLQVLLPVLLSAFLDAAPSAFSPTSNPSSSSASSTSVDLPLDTVVAVTEVARDLWRALLGKRSAVSVATGEASADKAFAEVRKGVEKLVGYMGAYFPFGVEEVGKRTAALQNLSIAYCELVSLLFLASSQGKSESGRDTAKTSGIVGKTTTVNSRLMAQLSHVQKYIAGLLSHSKTAVLPSASSTLNPHSYIELLPSIWALLLASPDISSTTDTSLFESLVQHYMRLSASSGVKKLAFEFIFRIVLLQHFPAYTGKFVLRPDGMSPATAQALEDMVVALPRYLWELGDRDPRMTQLLLRYLRHLARTSGLSPTARNKMGTYLVPYFVSQHASKGSITGPFLRLRSTALQKRTLETVWWLQREDEDGSMQKLLEAVDLTVSLDSKNHEIKDKWRALRCSM